MRAQTSGREYIIVPCPTCAPLPRDRRKGEREDEDVVCGGRAGRVARSTRQRDPDGPAPRITARWSGVKSARGDAFADPRTDVALAVNQSRNVRSRCRCSVCPAIHITSRSWLRSSSTHEPSDPPHRVFAFSFGRSPTARATRAEDLRPGSSLGGPRILGVVPSRRGEGTRLCSSTTRSL